MTTVGFAHIDITPAIGCTMQGYAARTGPATGVLDPLYARAMVLESQGARVAVVGTDLIGVHAGLTERARAVAHETCGIEDDAILVCGSHTHWGPALEPTGYLGDLDRFIRPEYAGELAHALGMAVALADSRRAPARIGAGVGWNPLISFNRRPIDDDGQCHMNLVADAEVAAWAAAEGARQAVDALTTEGLGPTPLRPAPARPEGELGALHWGPTDPEVPLLRIEADGAAAGGLVSFACHPVCGAGDDAFYDISADYPGALQATLTRALGVPMVFALGCAGDQVPIQRGPGSRQRMGRSLGGEVLRAWDAIDLRDDVPLAAARLAIELPIKDFASMDVPEGDDAHARYVRHLVEKWSGKTHVETEVQALRIGEMGLVSLPGEVFVEVGLALKRCSPFPITMPISQADGSVGYIPTREAYAQGGYEPGWNIASPDAADALIEHALRALDAVTAPAT